MPSKPHPRTSINRRRALALAVHVALVSVPLYAADPVTTQQQTRRYDIAPGSLATVLARFAQESGVAISFDSQQVQRLSSPGFTGSYSVSEGFARILRGSGFIAQSGAGGYILLPAPNADALQLGVTNIDSRTLGATTEGTGSYTTAAVTIS